MAIIEIGGTVGDIESLPFLEAIRQLKGDLGKDNVCYIHLTLVPYIKTAGEVKTKPTQHSVKELRTIGIQPNLLLCRTEKLLSQDIKAKIALFCNVEPEAVITAQDVDNIYEIPLLLHQEGLDERIVEVLKIWTRQPQLEPWEELVTRIKNPKDRVEIGIVGKYVDLRESYKSLHEALVHGGMANEVQVALTYIDSEEWSGSGPRAFGPPAWHPGARRLRGPGRGGQNPGHPLRPGAKASPIFGICFGMQLAVIEFARHLAGLTNAHQRGVRPRGGRPGHLPDAGVVRLPPGRDHPPGPGIGKRRHHAPGGLSLRPHGRVPGRPGLRQDPRSWNATATATNSTTTTGSG